MAATPEDVRRRLLFGAGRQPVSPQQQAPVQSAQAVPVQRTQPIGQRRTAIFAGNQGDPSRADPLFQPVQPPPGSLFPAPRGTVRDPNTDRIPAAPVAPRQDLASASQQAQAGVQGQLAAAAGRVSPFASRFGGSAGLPPGFQLGPRQQQGGRQPVFSAQQARLLQNNNSVLNNFLSAQRQLGQRPALFAQRRLPLNGQQFAGRPQVFS